MADRFEMPHCEDCGSRGNSIFCRLVGVDLEDVSTSKSCSIYKRGQSIFTEGNRPNGVFCVYSGKVKVYKLDQDGREQITRLAKQGDILGYRSLISGDVYSASAEPLEEAKICHVPSSVFFEKLESNRNLSKAFMKLLSDDLRVAESRLADMAHKPVRERVAEALLMIAEMYGLTEDKAIDVNMTRQDLANIVGTASESVIRLLSELKKEGLIRIQGRNIHIEDHKGLVNVANIFD